MGPVCIGDVCSGRCVKQWGGVRCEGWGARNSTGERVEEEERGKWSVWGCV